MHNGVLNHLRVRLAGWLALRVLLVAAGMVGALALAAVLSDAALDLPESLRLAAPWLLFAAALAIFAAGFLDWRGLSEPRVARLFERANRPLGNRLINAVQLSQKTGATDIEEYLRSDAVKRGRQAAASLSARRVMRGGLRAAGLLLGGVALAWLVLVLVGNDVLRAVLPRFLDAHGDHPPYSRLRLAVVPGPADVLYGGQLEVRATTSGRPADKLWLVARSPTNETRTLMFLAPDRSFFQTLANLREPAEYFVTDGAARSRRFPIRIRYTPQITLVEVTTVFPDYTGKPARTGKLSDEAQSLPEGTRVSFRAASNRPLQSGALNLTPVLGGKPIAIPLQPGSNATLVTGEFTLTEPVAFHLSVRDVDGLDCADPRRGRFNILPDEKPRLFVLEPGRDAVATPSIQVPVRVQASDDYGVSRVVWLRGLNRSIERPFNMKLALKSGPQSVESAGAFALDQLGVRPGDVIEYYFEAADTYPKGPNLALSRPFRLEIISKEQYEAILRQAAARKALFEPYFKLGAWLRRLAERSRALEAQANSGDPAARAEAEALAKELDKYNEELGKLLQSPAMFDVEQPFRTSLVAQHTRVGDATKKLKSSLGPPGSGVPDPKQLKEASDALSELAQAEAQQVGEPARQIAAVVQLVSRADAFVRMSQQQAVIAQMLRRFAEQTNGLSRIEQMEVQELAHQQRRVQQALQAWTNQLPELLAQVPADPEYDPLRRDVTRFLEAVAGAKIADDLAGAAITLEASDPGTGYPLALRAAEKMDRLIAKCESLPQQGQACLTARFQPRLMRSGMSDAVGQILAALGVGDGVTGRDGYGLFNDDVALYGPNVELAGEQAGGRGDTGRSDNRRVERVSSDARDPGLPQKETAGRVRLQPDAKFPLRYRDLVGDYFRAIAESEQGGAK